MPSLAGSENLVVVIVINLKVFLIRELLMHGSAVDWQMILHPQCVFFEEIHCIEVHNAWVEFIGSLFLSESFFLGTLVFPIYEK